MSSTQVPPVARPARRPVRTASPRTPQEGRFLLLGAVWALAILALTVFSYKRFLPPGSVLTNPDAMDFAQIARNIAAGHGYATSILRPLAVTGFTPLDSAGTAPDVSRAPLYPLLLMLCAVAHGGHLSDNVVLIVSLSLFLATVFAAYRLARLLFPAPEQAGIALLSAGLYGIGGEALGFALLGLPVALATLMVTLLLIALYRAMDVPGRPAGIGSAILVGVLAGLCYLTQYSLLLLAAPALVYLFFSRAPERAWAGAGAGALGFFVVTGAWMARNAHLSHGDPFFTLLFYSLMDQSADYPGYSTIYRSAAPPVGPLIYFYTHLPDMIAREGRGLTFYRDTLLQVFNVFLLAAAVASLLWRPPDARLNALRGYAAFCLLALILVTALFAPDASVIAPFAPIVIVVAVGYVFSTVAAQNWETLLQRTAIWTLGLLVGLGALIQFAGRKPMMPNPVSNGIGQVSALGLKANQAVISDTPWEVTWRTGLPAVWLPADSTAFQAVTAQAGQSGVTIDAMLLTPLLSSYDLGNGEASAWVALSKNPLAADKQPQIAQAAANYVRKSVPGLSGATTDQLARTAQYQQVYGYYLSHFDPELGACGPISDVMATFGAANPRDPSVPEFDNFPSTLFLRRQTPLTGI